MIWKFELSLEISQCEFSRLSMVLPSTKFIHFRDGVSKRVSPRENNVGDGRRNFCFVDFTTREEAKAAKDSIDGTFYRDAPLKVSAAIPRSQRQTQQSSREETTVVNSRIRDGEKWH